MGPVTPEQAQGKKVDARSDIFSFGSLLYEMVTGHLPFDADSNVSTLGAIIHKEPELLGSKVPHDLEKVITRCLRKDPARRFQHMDDVKIALEELKEESDSGIVRHEAPPKPTTRRRLLWWAAVPALLVLAIAGVWFLRSRTRTPEATLTAVPLTSYPGSEDSFSFSPDGTQVAFQWCPEDPGKSCDIYVKQIGVEPPSQLTDTPAMEYSPAWSPDGRTIAFLRKLSEAATRCTLVLIPQRGGRERVLAELDFSRAKTALEGPYLTWTPDSKWLVSPVPEAGQGVWSLYLFSVETGEKRKLTSPPAELGAGGDTAPAFSPDGRVLAFARRFAEPSRSGLHLLRLAEDYMPRGEPERIALDNLWNSNATWTPDGQEIVFATGKGLWRMTAFKPAAPSRLPFAPDNARAPAISRQGNRLAYSVERSDTNIWRIDLREPGGKPGAPVRFIASTLEEFCPAYSPDGKRIAFVSNRSGSTEIWVCDSDGSNPIPLTSLRGPLVNGPKWSPDSQNVAFYANLGGNIDVYVVGANGGKPRRLTTERSIDHWPYWSRDGQSLYFASDRGGTDEIRKMPAGGGKAVQVSRDAGADLPHESPDGKFVYYSKGWPFPQSVWRVPAEGGEKTKVLDAVHPLALWTMGKEGIYFFTVPDKKGHSDLTIYEFATGKTRKILTIGPPARIGMGLGVSPDGRTILYTQVDEGGSDLMLVENFR